MTFYRGINIWMRSNLIYDKELGMGQPVIQAMPQIQQFLTWRHLEEMMQQGCGVKIGLTAYHAPHVHGI